MEVILIAILCSTWFVLQPISKLMDDEVRRAVQSHDEGLEFAKQIKANLRTEPDTDKPVSTGFDSYARVR